MSDDKCVMCGSTNSTSRVERHPLLMSPGVFINAPTEHCQDCGEKTISFVAFSHLVDWLTFFDGDVPVQFQDGGPHMVGFFKGPWGRTAWVVDGMLEYRDATDAELVAFFRSASSQDIYKALVEAVCSLKKKESILHVLSLVNTDWLSLADSLRISMFVIGLYEYIPQDFFDRTLKSAQTVWGLTHAEIYSELCKFGTRNPLVLDVAWMQPKN